jgi:hypothetical protein
MWAVTPLKRKRRINPSGIVVRIYTTFNIRNFAFSPQCVFLCFFWF